jgi:DUF917 family protein
VREAQRRHEDPIAAILSVEPGKLLYKGKVIDVERRATEGFLRGVARFGGRDDWRGAALTINFQNEWIVAYRDGEAIAMSPDLICVIDSVQASVGSETIRYGQRSRDRPAAAAGLPAARARCRPQPRLRPEFERVFRMRRSA